MRRTTTFVVFALALTLCAGSAWAQSPAADTLKVDYFANANTDGAPDATLRITNPGTSGSGLCAAIYVYDAFQELSECCSCFVSPNGLRTLSINSNLTSNPLTGATLTGGSIRVVSTTAVGRTCAAPVSLTPTAALRAWATHIQNYAYTITETASQDATLSTWEQDTLQSGCRAIHSVGSGSGICSCGTGD
jgi:hypothetical protein